MFGLTGKTSHKYRIAPLGNDDIGEAAQIHAAGFTTGWHDGSLAKLLDSKNTTGLGAFTSGKNTGADRPWLVAFVVYRQAADEAEIITLATAPKFRNKGAARALLEQMVRNALTERLKHIFLEVDAANKAALALYRKFGFVQIGVRQAYYAAREPGDSANNGSDALIMRLDLSA